MVGIRVGDPTLSLTTTCPAEHVAEQENGTEGEDRWSLGQISIRSGYHTSASSIQAGVENKILGVSIRESGLATGSAESLYSPELVVPWGRVIGGVFKGAGIFRSYLLNCSSKIVGSAQSTGTLGHAFLGRLYAYRYALDPRVSRVTLDLGYKRLLGGGSFKWGPRPDIGVLWKNGTVTAVEIASKTDDLFYLRMRNANFMLRNNINGNVKVITGARYLNKLFRW